MTSMSVPEYIPLQALNSDVFRIIISALSGQDLRSLSLCCKWVRLDCVPFLFRSLTVKLYRPLHRDRFIDSVMWPFIRSLTLVDMCPDAGAPERSEEDLASYRPLRFAEDILTCGVFEPRVLADILTNMSGLGALTLDLPTGGAVPHGLPWKALKVVLSSTCLRELSLTCLRTTLSTPTDWPSELHALATMSLPPLTVLKYSLHPYRQAPRAYSSEMDVMSTLAERLHGSLVALELPLELANLHAMSHVQWPHLRELRLIGEFSPSPPLTLVSVLLNMPQLRALELKLTPLVGSDMPPIWPPDYVSADEGCPSFELETLTISYPHAHDKFFSHLAPTMHNLSLRCWPHYSTYQWRYADRYRWMTEGREWYCSVAMSSSLLRILQACPSSPLQGLEIEYRADDGDVSLLSHIVVAFPALTFLKVYRYREHADVTVPVEAIAQVLSALRLLRTLRLHLDFADTPERTMLSRRTRDLWYDQEELTEFRRGRLTNTARVFARLLAPSVGSIWMLHPADGRSEWAGFQVAPAGTAGTPDAEVKPICEFTSSS
ncbi:hypothetical protein K466DRAFT_510954 [Polyporus arcularius HHB13444]|uniref:F-box domain-containing protein n=1 Tax=Polyporus arcularius HHB13444 TaxID=1314778 RepID=A0A5C3PVE6_9APHY|nr:hypothetical protein K466DRAFT_510954 [Polyporus arcularius HHB13444]